ncbi:hypothetical protein ACTJJ7_12215 [Phyllobacterium sp. 22229]|uniref:Uncharacterized protein n=1 Tax=Agrobacterium radiobacter TaxID=362 RepID=A0ABD5LTA4_AGRRD
MNDAKVEEATLKARIQVVDISELETKDSFKHNRFVAIAALYPRLNAAGMDRSNPDVRQAGAFVFNAVGVALSSPFLLAGKIVGGE